MQTGKAEMKKRSVTLESVIRRAEAEGLITANYDRMTAHMDLESAVINDGLDLAVLMTFKAPDFAHDICGLARHMDRTTWPGRCVNCFVPRASRA